MRGENKDEEEVGSWISHNPNISQKEDKVSNRIIIGRIIIYVHRMKVFPEGAISEEQYGFIFEQDLRHDNM